MPLLTINLRDVLLAQNQRVEREFVSVRRRRKLREQELAKLMVSPTELAQLGYERDADSDAALRMLGINNTQREAVPEDRLPAERIVHLEAIRRICTNYGLVFRPFQDYRGQLAREVAIEVLRLRALLGHDPTADRFFVAAPKEMFCDSLTANDPFLFYEIGPDEYYLVHQWGLDSSPLRLIAHWPRGTRLRLFVTRTLLCAAAAGLVAYVDAATEVDHVWPTIGFILTAACWIRSFWAFKYRRGAHERHWYQS
jgi:hypothetical protein